MDYAISHRQSLIASADATAQSSADDQIKAMQYRLGHKRIQAINAMGAKLLSHPEYRFEDNPHHAPWVKESARLAPVYLAAKADGRI